MLIKWGMAVVHGISAEMKGDLLALPLLATAAVLRSVVEDVWIGTSGNVLGP